MGPPNLLSIAAIGPGMDYRQMTAEKYVRYEASRVGLDVLHALEWGKVGGVDRFQGPVGRDYADHWRYRALEQLALQ